MWVSVTYYISLYVGKKRLVFHLNPCDGHVITVSARLILTAVNSSSYGWITKCQFQQNLMWHLTSAYMKRVYGWAGIRYVITKFSRMDSLPNFLTHGAPLARARAPLIITNLNNNCDFNSSYNIVIVTFIKQDKNCIS